MSKRSIVLNFSGNDSAGLAGVSTDIRTQSAFKVHSALVITANTAQNNDAVMAINAVTDKVFESQLLAVSAMPIAVIKVGLVSDEFQIRKISDFVIAKKVPLVLDTVFTSSSGDHFSSEKSIQLFKEILLPQASLLTPNIMELKQLTGCDINSTTAIVSAANELLAMGASGVFVKGGHFHIEKTDSVKDPVNIITDYFTDGERSFWLSNKKVETLNNRGTGCALASAIASALALGYSIYDAVVIAKMAISQGLRQSYVVDKAYGPVAITDFPHQQIDLPFLSLNPVDTLSENNFPECNSPALGLYPVVDRAQWIERLATANVSTIQLRIKDLEGEALFQEIQKAVALSKQYNMRLFINDYWQLAIKYDAYGVHLGQEDLDKADLEKIRKAGLRLGISTHCHYEVARAHCYRPSYIACGPVYHTNTKDMPWTPHGLEGLSYWRKVLEYPLVAIGGINQQRLEAVKATGVDSIAMITAITLAEQPIETARSFVEACR